MSAMPGDPPHEHSPTCPCPTCTPPEKLMWSQGPCSRCAERDALAEEVERLRGLLKEAQDQMNAATFIRTNSLALADVMGRIDAALKEQTKENK